MRGSCPGFYALGEVPGDGCLFRCSRRQGHRGHHLAVIQNSPLGRICARWAE